MPPKILRKKKKHKKAVVDLLPDLPKRGDSFLFRYHKSPTFCHKVYEDFPSGVQVLPQHCNVDFSQPIIVQDVRAAEMNGSKYVAVSFVLPDFFGVELWTNYSKDGKKWMIKALL